MIDLTCIIMTFNEELNIKECIESILPFAKRIVIVDSNSTDRTVAIAEEMGAEVIYREFTTHAEKFQYGLDHAQIQTKWVMRLDADERLTPESGAELESVCQKNMDTDINGVILRFEVNFLGKKLKHGGIYPFNKLIVFKYGLAEIEKRNQDEHIFLTSGKSVALKHDSLHKDYKNLSYWIEKHNHYSTKEMQDYFINKQHQTDHSLLPRKARSKRFIKNNIYYHLPMGFRASLYFLYRYIFKLGFLDGKEGLIFAFLQAYWYRFLVDAKIYEALKNGRNNL